MIPSFFFKLFKKFEEFMFGSFIFKILSDYRNFLSVSNDKGYLIGLCTFFYARTQQPALFISLLLEELHNTEKQSFSIRIEIFLKNNEHKNENKRYAHNFQRRWPLLGGSLRKLEYFPSQSGAQHIPPIQQKLPPHPVV